MLVEDRAIQSQINGETIDYNDNVFNEAMEVINDIDETLPSINQEDFSENESISDTVETLPTHLLPEHLSGDSLKPKRGRPPKNAAEKQKMTPAILKLCKKIKTIKGYSDLIKTNQVTINDVVDKLGGSRSTVAKAVKIVKDGGYDEWLTSLN